MSKAVAGSPPPVRPSASGDQKVDKQAAPVPEPDEAQAQRTEVIPAVSASPLPAKPMLRAEGAGSEDSLPPRDALLATRECADGSGPGLPPVGAPPVPGALAAACAPSALLVGADLEAAVARVVSASHSMQSGEQLSNGRISTSKSRAEAVQLGDEACAILGISRRQLHERITSYAFTCLVEIAEEGQPHAYACKQCAIAGRSANSSDSSVPSTTLRRYLFGDVEEAIRHVRIHHRHASLVSAQVCRPGEVACSPSTCVGYPQWRQEVVATRAVLVPAELAAASVTVTVAPPISVMVPTGVAGAAADAVVSEQSVAADTQTHEVYTRSDGMVVTTQLPPSQQVPPSAPDAADPAVAAEAHAVINPSSHAGDPQVARDDVLADKVSVKETENAEQQQADGTRMQTPPTSPVQQDACDTLASVASPLEEPKRRAALPDQPPGYVFCPVRLPPPPPPPPCDRLAAAAAPAAAPAVAQRAYLRPRPEGDGARVPGQRREARPLDSQLWDHGDGRSSAQVQQQRSRSRRGQGRHPLPSSRQQFRQSRRSRSQTRAREQRPPSKKRGTHNAHSHRQAHASTRQQQNAHHGRGSPPRGKKAAQRPRHR